MKTCTCVRKNAQSRAKRHFSIRKQRNAIYNKELLFELQNIAEVDVR